MRRIPTRLGGIAVEVATAPAGEDAAARPAAIAPVIFLHGVFLDRSLWDACRSGISGRRQVLVDMPAHGDSDDAGRDFTLDECATMLIEILDALEIARCVAVGHSWGAMTALRAAHAHPGRFSALGLCNMPHRRDALLGRTAAEIERILAARPRVYAKQAAASLYAPESLAAHPEWSAQMQDRVAARPAREIARVLAAVVLEPVDAEPLLAALRPPALAVVGEHDYVGTPPHVASVTVPGGHVSPQEAPGETRAALRRIIALAGEPAR